MKAPKKIYLEKEYPDNRILPNGISYSQTSTNIEYTSTDVFIEKACEWIMNRFSSEGFGSPLYYKGFLYRPEDIVEDFKKDMKGK